MKNTTREKNRNKAVLLNEANEKPTDQKCVQINRFSLMKR